MERGPGDWEEGHAAVYLLYWILLGTQLVPTSESKTHAD